MDIITKSEAKAAGLKLYFTGNPCRREHVDYRRTDSGVCAECDRENSAARRAADPEKAAAAVREWRARNPGYLAPSHADKEARRAQGRARYAENRTEKREAIYEWRRKNSEKFAASLAKYRAKNFETLKAKAKARLSQPGQLEALRGKQRIYYRNNADMRTASTRRWRAENPEKARASDRNKKAIRKGAEGTHTQADIERIYSAQKGKCAHCKVKIKSGYHVDHIKPLSRGGSNWPRNLQLLCPACNMRKHATDPVVFAQREGMLL